MFFGGSVDFENEILSAGCGYDSVSIVQRAFSHTRIHLL